MKIDEPKTPYNYRDPALNESDQLDANALAEKLKVAAADSSGVDEDAVDGGAGSRSFYTDEDSDDEEEEKIPETEEEKGNRIGDMGYF